jgi:glycosyltransferase involved in cell wall biosynthesis
MKIAITAPAKFPAAFRAARYHEGRGELASIISPVPVARSRRFGVSDARNRGIAMLGAWNLAVQRYAPRAMQQHHQLAFSAAFDAIAARMIAGCDAVNPWCSTALHTIRAAHRRGLPAVLEVASAHIEAQAELMRGEYRRFGGDIDRAVITPGVVARTVAEYAEADAIIVTSSFVKRTLAARGVEEGKIAVVPYGFDPAPAMPERGDAHTPRVLFVGGCSLRKGIPYLVDAFRALDAQATLRLVGRPNDALFERIGGLPPNVVATGPRSGAALAAEYASADIFVLPSVEDGYGLVTNEAMSAGLPVIVSNHAGSAEVVRDGENGFVVPARDAAALVDRLSVLVRDATLQRRMGESARATALARTWNTYGDERNAQVYARLIPRSQREASRAAAA